MAACAYTFKDADGQTLRLVGKPALKAYLASGGLQHLLGDSALAARAPALSAEANFARVPAVKPRGMRVAEVEAISKAIVNTWANRADVVVATDMQDEKVPQDVREEDARQRQGGAEGDVKGFYHDGKIYVIANAHNTEVDVVKTVLHEGLGHHGLRSLYGDELASVLRDVARARPIEVANKIKEYGYDPKKRLHVLIAAEEVLAEMAQTRPELGFVQRAIATILTWLRKNVPALKDLRLSDAEVIRDFILPARAFVEQGGEAARVADSETSKPRFSRSTPAQQDTGLTPPEQGLLRRVQSAVQNNMTRVRQVQDRIEKLAGAKLKDVADYYGAETNRPGRIAARLEDAENTMLQPLMEKLAKSGHTMADLSELLHAMHAEERNEAVAKINPEMPDGGSGMTDAEAAAILKKYQGNTKLHRLAQNARDIARATLDLKLAYGQISQDDYDTLTTRYDYYVPLKGDGEYGPKIKRAMGHDEREEFILENIARDYQQAVVTGEKNLARQSLLAMVLENKDEDLWTVGVPPKGRYVAGTVFSVKKAGQEVATFTSSAQVSAFLEAKGATAGQYEVSVNGERVREFAKPLQDNEVMVYVEGQPVRIQIHDETLARQLRPLDQGRMNPILEGMRSMMRYLSKIYTGYNPAFIPKNFARDTLTGTINILGNEGAGTTAKAWANYPAAIKALSVWAATGATPDGEAGRYLQEYRANGGKTGASWMSDLEQQGKTLERLFDDAYGARGYLADGKAGKAAAIAGRKIVGGLAHVIEVANQATENGLRLALFMAMRKQGVSASKAAQAAKNVTVDFDRKGTMTPALGAIYLFINPAIQGTANAIKTLVKGEHKAQAWAALGMLATLGAFAALSGMDDDDDRWLGESWSIRSKNFIMDIGGKHIQVPLSQEFAPFYAFGVAIAEAMRGQSKVASAGRLMSSFFDAYFPLQGAYDYDSDDHAMDAIGSVIPTVIKPAYQSAVNRNSFGTQIVPENEFTKNRPDNLKMSRGTKNSVYDKSAQGIAAAGQAVTGAGKYENDITKVSPETLKFMWRTYTGGLGQFVTDSMGLASMGADDAGQIETGDVPIVKDFVKANDVKAIRGRFYDLAKDAKKAATEFEQAKKAGDGEELDRIFSRPDAGELISLDKLVSKTIKAAAKLRDEAVDVNADESLSPSEKRARLKEIERDEEQMYRDAIGAFKH